MKFPDLAFNAAVMTMANTVCPTGYDVAEGAPDNLSDLNARIAKTGRILVERANSGRTIFYCPEHNWAFRAWHDWTHYTLQAKFDLNGELAVAHHQCQVLVTIYGHDIRTADWCRIIMAEVYGQALYKHVTGKFPTDQVAFDHAWINMGGHAAIEYIRRIENV